MTAVPFAPAWFRDNLLDIYAAHVSHVFLLTGNVKDYVLAGGGVAPLEEFLLALGGQRPIVFSYSISTGFRFPSRDNGVQFRRAAGLDATAALPIQPQLAAAIMERVLTSAKVKPRSVFALLPYVETIAPGGSSASQSQEERSITTTLTRWADSAVVAEKAILLLLAESSADVADPLRASQSGLHVLRVPRPEQIERAAFVEWFLDQRQRHAEPAVITLIAEKTQGLTLKQIEDILLREQDIGEAAAITAKKIEILTREYGDVLEIIEPKHGLDAVGGLDYAIAELREVADLMRKQVISAAPMGIMFMGPPGTGKSYLAECFAKECGLLSVKFKPLRQMYVGASERNQERAFSAIRALAPVVVIVDESDQEEQARGSGPSGDSGVSERMRGQAFQFWGDQNLRGKVLRIDITNRVDLIDPAMRRSGRTDIKIPILMPDEPARTQILGVIVKKHKFQSELNDYAALASKTDGFAGSDLELLATTAYRFACRRGDNASITEADWSKALEDFIVTARDQKAIARMTLLAIDECRSRRLLPSSIDRIRADAIRVLGESGE